MNPDRYLPVIGTVIAGLVLSLWGFQFLRSREHHVMEADFRALARDQVSTIEREVRSNLEVLDSLRAFYSTVPEVGHEQFESFTQPLRGLHQGIQALEWIPRVPQAERDEYEARAREHYPEFAITERQQQGVMVRAADRAEYFPVYLVSPYEGNEAALGFDLASSPTRLQAINSSRASGDTIATAPIHSCPGKRTSVRISSLLTGP